MERPSKKRTNSQEEGQNKRQKKSQTQIEVEEKESHGDLLTQHDQLHNEEREESSSEIGGLSNKMKQKNWKKNTRKRRKE